MRDAVLYYLPVMAYGLIPDHTFDFLLVNGTTNHRAKIYFVSGLKHKCKTRLHGSKHGNPASAEAAKPQGMNDQFFAEPDI